jgi:hypothetical protein
MDILHGNPAAGNQMKPLQEIELVSQDFGWMSFFWDRC